VQQQSNDFCQNKMLLFFLTILLSDKAKKFQGLCLRIFLGASYIHLYAEATTYGG
jgi:hypothetical protein